MAWAGGSSQTRDQIVSPALYYPLWYGGDQEVIFNVERSWPTPAFERCPAQSWEPGPLTFSVECEVFTVFQYLNAHLSPAHVFWFFLQQPTFSPFGKSFLKYMKLALYHKGRKHQKRPLRISISQKAFWKAWNQRQEAGVILGTRSTVSPGAAHPASWGPERLKAVLFLPLRHNSLSLEAAMSSGFCWPSGENATFSLQEETWPSVWQSHVWFQFSSVTQSCPTLCKPMNRSMPGFPVRHQLPEFTQTHVRWVGDAIQPSHPLSSPSPPALNLFQHQSLQMSQLFASGGQSIGVSASTSVLPMNTQDWSPLGCAV